MARLEGNCSSPFAEISRLTNYQYSASRLYHHWHHNLNWRLCHDPLTQEEKDYINDWVRQRRLPNGAIRWSVLQKDMEQMFLRLHNTNKIKNYWRSNQNRISRTATTTAVMTNPAPSLPSSHVSIPVSFLVNDNSTTSPSPTVLSPIPQTSRSSVPFIMEPNFTPEPQFNVPYGMRPFF
ncbi:601_t:CDS:2 [Funneliformis caledonium]|uniref:601_t:CDS:1 n=1 Tax=Funneliformis caledonium TaxID=1117310 RepID=A0A9N9EMQ7_9GLOM|nr:601_t:CDS:2 [Funneliformis caledonium]